MKTRIVILSFLCLATLGTVFGVSNSSIERVIQSRKKADAEARAYVASHKNTYIAIIWPRAIDKYEGMRAILASHATIVYERPFKLKNYGPAVLYSLLHPGFWFDKIMKHMENYIPVGMPQPYHLCAILFETDASLAEIIAWKQEIRNYAGISYWSIHINDTYAETCEAAELVFDQDMIWKMNHSKSPTKILLA